MHVDINATENVSISGTAAQHGTHNVLVCGKSHGVATVFGGPKSRLKGRRDKFTDLSENRVFAIGTLLTTVEMSSRENLQLFVLPHCLRL